MKPILLLLLLASCCRYDITPIFDEIAANSSCRTGLSPRWQEGFCLNPEVEELLETTLSPCDAAWIALVHNQALQAEFEELGVSYSDFVQASLPRNPTFDLDWRLPPDGDNVESSLRFPLSDLWQTPLRRQVACKELRATQLDLIDKVLWVQTEAMIQADELTTAQQVEKIWQRVFDVQKELASQIAYRQANGVADPLEVANAQVLVGEAAIGWTAACQRARRASQELRHTLGLGDCYKEIFMETSSEHCPPLPDPEELVCKALRCSPSLQADYARVQAAKEKIRLEQARTVREIDFGAAYEAEEGTSGWGPSLFVEIPLFDQNRAQTSRAQYEWRQRARMLRDHQLMIAKEIRELHTEYTAACESARLMENEILPALNAGSAYATKYGKRGQIARVIEMKQQLSTLKSCILYLELLHRAKEARFEINRKIGQSATPLQRD